MFQDRTQPINILLAEDNPGDVFIIRSVLEESPVPYNFHHVMNGEAVLTFLHQEKEYPNFRPDLILLDLNLPLKHGFEVLEEIKSNPQLKMIPVIILTSSRAEQDISQSYNLSASCYVNKPVDFEQFVNILKSIEEFWLKFVQFPPQLKSQNI